MFQNKLLIIGAAVFSVLCSTASHAVQLGEENVPKQKFVVYLFIGHSNMAGWSEIADHEIHPRGWHFRLPEKLWEPAMAPLNPLPMGDGEHGGPGMPFIKEMVTLYPNHYIGVLQNAEVGATVRWSWADKNHRYQKGVPLYDDTIAAAKQVSQEATLGGIICMLGWVESIISTSSPESNADAKYAKSFLVDIQQMVATIRADLGQPELPFLIGMYQEGAPTTPPHRDLVISELAKIPGTVPFSAIVDSEGPYVDKSHYTYEGQVNWAKAAAAIIVEQGWFPEGNKGPDASVVTDASCDGGPDLSGFVADGKVPGGELSAHGLVLSGGCGLAEPRGEKSRPSWFYWLLVCSMVWRGWRRRRGG